MLAIKWNHSAGSIPSTETNKQKNDDDDDEIECDGATKKKMKR